MRRLWILLVAIILGGVVTAEGDVRPQLHLGAGSCAAQACHGGGFESRMEYKIWATKDPHGRAFASLQSERGQRMAQRVGYDVTKSDACLCCHGTTGVEVAETFDQADGVSCENCHGGAKQWLGLHVEEEWRRKRPEDKEKETGLRDLSTPKRRVEQCVQCHVGTAKRPMTHEIMAAGHPPLTFDGGISMRTMHAHWKDKRDLTAESWLEGLRAAAAAELERLVLAARARRAWIEFSVFDCYSCHHAVYQGGVYAEKDLSGKPGALPLDLAPLRVLVRVSGRATMQDFGAILKRTHVPSADPRELANEAEEAARKLRALDLGPPDPDRWRANLMLWFAHKKESRVPPHVMQQLASTVDALAPDRDSSAYRAAYAALRKSVDPTQPYDAAKSARLGLEALKAAGYPPKK